MTDGWTLTAEHLPDAFESVQAFIPTQYPFPRVREGYIVDDENGEPLFWFIPGLREKYPVYDFIVAWKPLSDPPEWKL